MKTKNISIKLATLLMCLLCLTLTATAQKRRPAPKKTTKDPAATTAPTTTSNTAIKDEAKKVSDQLVNVSRFIYLLGGIAQGMEEVDKDTKASPTAVATNNKNKQAVIASLQNLRAGLTALEDDFRTQDQLRNYEIHITGITELSAQAEDQGKGGQFKDSGKSLLQIIEKLSDTLVALP